MMSNQTPKIDPRNVADILSLTPLQTGMLFHYISNPGTPLYFEQLSICLSGALDAHLFRKAWEIVFQTNEMLRVVFRWEKIEQPVQIVLKQRDVPLSILNLSEMSLAEKPDRLAEIKRKDREKPLDLTREPIRLILCKMDPDHYELLISSHHILYDGWSNGIVLKEFFEVYQALATGQSEPVFTKPKFKEFVKWLQSRDLQKSQVFWKEYLQGFNSKTDLPANAKKLAEISALATYQCNLPDDLTHGIHGFLKDQNLTLANLLYGAWGILLQRYNDTDDVLFGTTIAGREAPISDLGNTVGLFINTIPLRFHCNQEADVASVLQGLSKELQQRTEYETASLTDIKACSELDKQSALFDSIVVIDNYPLSVDRDHAGNILQAKSFAIFEMTNFDLTLQVYTFDRVELQFHYNRDLFEADTIRRLAEHYQRILQEICDKPLQKLLEIDLLTEIEKEKLLYEFNQTKVPYPKDQLIHQLISEQAQKTPERIAVVFEDRQLTYKELDNEANQVAALLQENGIKSGDMVGLLIPRSVEMILGMLGILKANAICVPLDTEHPQERIQTILEDSSTQILLQLTGTDFVPNYQGTKLNFNREKLALYPQTEPVNRISSDHLVYLIYTSGSTGKPKGAMLNHYGIINHVLTKIAVLGITAADTVGNNFSVNVIAAIWQILAPLFCGAKLVIHAEAVEKDPYLQFTKIATDGISVIEIIPSVLSAYLSIVENGKPLVPLPGLRKIALTSEETKTFLVNKFYQYYHIPLVDCYGQTECSDDTLHYEIPISTKTTLVPIGMPSHNTRAYIFSRHNQLQPIGVRGELCISGDGVGRGYWNKPELTAAKFMPNPLEPGKIMYRTGDLARWSPKGYVIYQGRLDHQVKIRGNRIELGEIESQLLKYPSLCEVAVVARENKQGETYLAAFMVTHEEVTVSELRAFLAKTLPDYMIPAWFMRLEQMPLTPNGKIDRKRLPKNESNLAMGNQFVPPGTETEQQLAMIWQQVLHKNELGIDDNFFDLGGHSLLLIQVRNKIQEVFGREIPVVEMFHYPTIRLLAEYLNPKKNLNSAVTASREQVSNIPVQQERDTTVAIIGMAGYFPGAANIGEFWENLIQGRETVSRFQSNELENPKLNREIIDDPLYVKAGGVLEGIDHFDAGFFGFNPREAELTDPQQRLFLKCAWEALENAGYDPDRYPGKIGVYAGVGMNTYLIHHLLPEQELIKTAGDFQTVIGNDKDFAATRVSYKLNLKGPSMTVQTACSTSLVAAHLAGRALAHGECDIALAGAAFIRLPQKTGYYYQSGSNLSPDGHCRTFDCDAKGTVFGNGVGVVALKPLADASRDGDHIYAIIQSSAINNDGSQKVGYTAPSIDGQAEVISQAIAAAGINPESIGYIEAHGTATELGDPIEIAALHKSFQKFTNNKGFCAVGSVKTNIGHLDVAAGIAGLIKTALTLENKKIPPSLHFTRPNPAIDFLDTPFYVNDRLQEWETGSEPRRAGVSCFGIGGTNVHMILEEAPSSQFSEPARPGFLLTISARTEKTLDVMAQNLAKSLTVNLDLNLADLAYTLQVGRREFQYRKAVLCHDRKEAIQLLEGSYQSPVIKNTVLARKPRLIFNYDLPSTLDWEFLKELNYKEPAFQRLFNLNCEWFKRKMNLDVETVLNNGNHPVPDFPQQAHTQAMFGLVVQYTVIQVLQEWGIQPDGFVGLHQSELTAACLAGVLTLEDGLELMVAKGSSTFKQKLKEIELRPPQIPFISKRNGTWIQPGDATNGDYWSSLDEPEPTNQTWTGLLEPDDLLLSICQTVVSNLEVERNWESIVILPPHSQTGRVSGWLEMLGRLWETGIAVNWNGFYGPEKRCRVPLPTYPFAEERYWIEPVSKSVPVSNDSKTDMSNPISTQLYLPVWKQAPLVHAADWRDTLGANSVWLIFADELGLGSRFGRELTQAGETVITVTAGTEFRRISQDSYQLNPNLSTDYQFLFRDLKSQGRQIERIIHLWNIGNQEQAGLHDYDRFRIMQYGGFYSLVYIAKAMAESRLAPNIKIWAISDGTQNIIGMETLVPEKTTILGAGMVLNQEYDFIRCNCIDLASAELQPNRFGAITETILQESIRDPEVNLIAFRGGQRWTLLYEPVTVIDESKHFKIRSGGVYMITGGLGKIGLEIAEYFAKFAAIKLILTGRASFPEQKDWEQWIQTHDSQNDYSRRINKIRNIEALGSEVTTVNVDITDFEAMQKLMNEICSRFGKINGIIHGAGITGEAAITLISEFEAEKANAQFRPKVQGLYNIQKICAGKSLDFCVLLSSVASVLGGLGSATYTASNIFLDQYAQKQNQAGESHFISVNWDKWVMNKQESTPKLAGDSIGLSPAEGVAVLGKVLNWPVIPQVIAAVGDLNWRYRRAFPKQTGSEQASNHLHNSNVVYQRPKLSSTYTAAHNPVETIIAGIWEKVIGVSPVGIHDNFFELGGHSLLATQVTSRLREIFRVEIPLRRFFETPTVREMAAEISQLVGGDEVAEKIVMTYLKFIEFTAEKG